MINISPSAHSCVDAVNTKNIQTNAVELSQD